MVDSTSGKTKTRKNDERNARNGREQVLDGEVWDNTRLLVDGGHTVRVGGLHFLRKCEKSAWTLWTTASTVAGDEMGVGETSGRTRTFV